MFQFVCATPELQAAFHRAVFAQGMLNYEGDNQAVSLSTDEEAIEKLCRRMARVAATLNRDASSLLSQRVDAKARFSAAWSMINGVPDQLPLP